MKNSCAIYQTKNEKNKHYIYAHRLSQSNVNNCAIVRNRETFSIQFHVQNQKNDENTLFF